MQWPLLMLALVLVLEQFTWMKLDAVEVKITLLTVHEAPLSAVTLALGGAGIHVQVLECDAKVYCIISNNPYKIK